jgi:hypothetical protein
MNDIIPIASSTIINPVPLPLPSANVIIRPGVMSDVRFMDSLQKLHTKQVGWMPTGQFEGKIKAGHVLIAEDETKQPVGYCIGNDQYFKRDDVGIIYQMNVLPGKQRGFIGASLLKAQFERSAYGCKLYCCWCAQDIQANHFWESMGFVALAFRAGSAAKSRVHIFWQKRIRQGDTTTPWWFPSQTTGGSIREDRIVLPIPPGTHWSDAKPLVLPGGPMPGDAPALPAPKAKRSKPKRAAPVRPSTAPTGGFWFAAPKPAVEAKSEINEREPKVKPKNDPRLVAAARELRDRWLERVNDDPSVLFSKGKYEVSRELEVAVSEPNKTPLLTAA